MPQEKQNPKRVRDKSSDPVSLGTTSGSPTQMPASKKGKDVQVASTTLDDIAKLIATNTQTMGNNHDELTKKFEALSQNVNEKITTIDQNYTLITNRIDTTDDAMDRLQKACDLRISGVPLLTDERANDPRLAQLFIKLANALQYNISCQINIPSMFRLKRRANGANDGNIESPTIIATFIAPHIKREFFEAYLKKLNLSTTDLGFLHQPRRIIINENLTKMNKQIFDEALQLRRQKRIHQVYTKNGLVFVRVSAGLKPVPVRSIRDLHAIVTTTTQANHEIVANNTVATGGPGQAVPSGQ